MEESQPEVLMLRNVLATTAHDIGGLASALLLRADVLEHGQSDATVRAMRSIAGELRLLGQQLRALREHDRGSALAPTPAESTSQWAARVTRFGVGLLPRGSAINCVVEDVRIPHALAHPLWHIALAVFGAICNNWKETRVSVHIVDEPQTAGTVLVVSATANGERLELVDAMHGAWWQWAVQHADQHQISLSAVGDRIRIATFGTTPT